jgi:hypothetical protein
VPGKSFSWNKKDFKCTDKLIFKPADKGPQEDKGCEIKFMVKYGVPIKLEK